MPPRKRGRTDREPSLQDDEQPPSPADTRSAASSSAVDQVDDELPPFFNVAFDPYRISPLYIGSSPLSSDRLRVLSQRLRDTLVGDVIRGVEIGLDRVTDNDAMARAGALEVVGMGWLRLEDLLGRYAGGDDAGVDGRPPSRDLGSDGDAEGDAVGTGYGPPGKRRALQILLQYENTECTALLLPRLRDRTPKEQQSQHAPQSSLFSSGEESQDHGDGDFLHLPLLLLRMPATLKSVVTDFLSSSFDCRVSHLSLGTRSLVRAWERWARESGVPSRGPFARDVAIFLGFYAPTVAQAQTRRENRSNDSAGGGGGGGGDNDEEEEAAADGEADKPVGLKTIDVIIPAADLRRFLNEGRVLGAEGGVRKRDITDSYDPAKRRRLGGNKDEEGWTWRRSDSSPSTGKGKGKGKGQDLGPSQHGDDDDDDDDDNDGVQSQPFTEALARYVRHHLALDMFHPAVRITKIGCGGFVLSESRVKILGAVQHGDGESGLSDAQQKSVWGIVEGLLERAQIVCP